jgi:hypothetical protein
MRKLEENNSSTPSSRINALTKAAYLRDNPGISGEQYDAMMAANRGRQPMIGATDRMYDESNPFSGSTPYDDSYMLEKIDKDPSSAANIRKRMQAQFAENMLMAVGTAFGPGMVSSAFNTFKTIPALYRAYKAANTASKVSKAPVKGLLQSPAPTNWTSGSGMYFQMGGEFPMEEYKKGGINLDPAKKGTFKAQATRMGMGVQEAASAILNAPEGKYTPKMRKKANFAKNFGKQMGGPVEGEVLDVTPEQLELLRQQGYEFEIM